MKKKIVMIAGLLFASVFLHQASMQVQASDDGNEYITITVQAEDDNAGITYALDSNEPDAFGEANSFVIQAGTSHTIYVKDAAGNITSQQYEPAVSTQPIKTDTEDISYIYGSERVTLSDDVDDSINIDLEIGNSDSENDYYEISVDSPAEDGNGSLYSKNHLNGTDTDEQIFYSLTTADGDVFYLLVDQTQEENNVYLLNQVHNSDLAALAEDDTKQTEDDDSDSLLKALSDTTKEDTNTLDTDTAEEKEKSGSNSRIIILVFIVIGGVAYYYFKVYKDKKNQEMDLMDAPDMDDFEGENDEDEYDFEEDDEAEKQAFMDKLLSDDSDSSEWETDAEEEYQNYRKDEEEETDEEVYATSHKESKVETDNLNMDIFSDSDEYTAEFDEELDGSEEEE